MSDIKNIAVIYKSIYGTTKRYAEWIADDLDASIFEAANIKPSQLLDYDVVIYGGGLYAGGIIGVKLVTASPCNSLIVFTVGAANPSTTDYSGILKKNFTPELLSETKIFHLQGGIDYNKLGFAHKIMMAWVKKFRVEKNPELRSDEDKMFMESYGDKFDCTNRAAIKLLVDYARGGN